MLAAVLTTRLKILAQKESITNICQLHGSFCSSQRLGHMPELKHYDIQMYGQKDV
jgi:hypothetical protein